VYAYGAKKDETPDLMFAALVRQFQGAFGVCAAIQSYMIRSLVSKNMSAGCKMNYGFYSLQALRPVS
jgi:hypothetical protein